MNVCKSKELNEIATLLEQRLLYRKVFFLVNDCRKHCGKDCKKCQCSNFKITHSIVEFSEFDETKHFSTKDAAKKALAEIQKNLKPIYDRTHKNAR